MPGPDSPGAVPADRAESWADRLTGAIARTGRPEGPAYAAAAAVVFAALTLSQWVAGTYPVGTFEPLHAVIALGVAAYPWMIATFNRSARRAMERVRPALGLDDEELARATAELVRAPALVDAVVGLTWLVLTLVRLTVDPSQLGSLRLPTSGLGYVIGVAVVALFVLSASAYVVKVAHLAVGIRRVARGRLAVSLWELGPLHGFSTLTAQMAASMVASIVVLYGARPDALRDPYGLAAAPAGLVIAGAIFVLPLLGIHDRLVAEKARLRGEAAGTMEAAVRGLHHAVETGDLASMDAHYKAVAAVQVELQTLAGIPTWPWLPDTFRWVIGALMFPIVLFLIQLAVTRLTTL